MRKTTSGTLPMESRRPRHGGGHSNETLFLTWGDRDLVLRRPPPGGTAESASDLLREYTVLEAVQDTPVPTPDVLHACSDHSVIGSDFYVMERLERDVLRDEEPERFRTPAARRRIGEKGYATRAALVARDERQTRIEFENARFDRTLTAFKMGGIGEMFFRRYLEGNSDHDRYPLMEAHVPRRVERAKAFIEGEEDRF
jgi:aminoglycoside phosphotransferase (APT) family kinase protein